MAVPRASRAPHTPWARSALIGIVLSAAVSLVVVAFSWPSATSEPRDLPIAITGPAAVVAPVQAAIESQSDGAIALVEVADRAAAVTAIETREVYGAIVLGAAPEVLTASAASTASSQLMTQLHGQLQAMLAQFMPGTTVALTDVVPLSEGDPRGAGLTAAAFPLVLGGMIGGIAIAFLISGAWRRVLALFAYAIAGGLAIAGILQGWFGVLVGDYLVNASVFSLTLLAMGATIVGFGSLFGRAGIAVGPVLFMLIGNPISGAAFPKEFLPAPWGDIGQYLPPGAGATLLRTVSYFPEANPAFPIIVLACWAVGGLLLTAIGHFRDQGRTVIEADPAESAATATA